MESYEGIEISYSHEEQLANFVIRNFNVRRRNAVHPSRQPPSTFSFIFYFNQHLLVELVMLITTNTLFSFLHEFHVTLFYV